MEKVKREANEAECEREKRECEGELWFVNALAESLALVGISKNSAGSVREISALV